jgi:hypothetical protein
MDFKKVPMLAAIKHSDTALQYSVAPSSICVKLKSINCTPELQNHPFSALRDCLFNIFAATVHIWMMFWNFTYSLKLHNNDFEHEIIN